VFICGETEAMVPWMMVPGKWSEVGRGRGGERTVFELNGDAFVDAFHQEPVGNLGQRGVARERLRRAYLTSFMMAVMDGKQEGGWKMGDQEEL
jgi:hypothetical protein